MTGQTNTLKAYRAYDKSEDSDYGMMIVLAESASEARQIGWLYSDDIGVDEYIDMRVKRERWADVYATTTEIPLQAYLENGWRWSCKGCGDMVGVADIGGVTAQEEPLCERCARERGLTRPAWAKPEEGMA